MACHRVLALALLSSVFFQASAKDVLDDVAFDVVTRELEADMDLGDTSDMDEALRKLQSDNGTTTEAPATTTTAAPTGSSGSPTSAATTVTPTAPPAGGPVVRGSLEIAGLTSAQATEFTEKDSTREAFKRAIAQKAAADGSISKDAVMVTFTIARRLQEADGVEPRALQDATVVITCAYEISFPEGTDTTTLTSIVDTLTAVTGEEFQTAILAELPEADRTQYGSLMTITPVAPILLLPTTTAAEPEVSGAAKMAITSSALALIAAWLASAQV